MAVKFFGQYLLEKNIIRPQDLVEAVEYQESKNQSFGECAMSKGYLTMEDVKKIQNEQIKTDMQFGEIAVKSGLLTPDRVEEILTIQKNNRIFIGRALVEKGFITREILDRELALFKEDQRKYVTGEIITPDGIENPEIVKDIVDMTQKMLQRLTRLNIKAGEGFITDAEPEKNFLLISVSLSGSHRYEYVFSSSHEISRLIASAFIDEEIQNDQTNIIADGVKEFCNITCGNIIAKLSLRGLIIDISPPEEVNFSANGYNLLKGREALYYTLTSPRGDSTLIVIGG